LRQAAEEVSEPAVQCRVRDLEVDEFRSFVGDKEQRRWTWYGFDRQRRMVITSVNDRRTDGACGRLLKKLEGCQVSRYHTDGWQSYKKLLSARKHKVGKEGTQCVERNNLSFRTHIKRLQRGTICYSKSVEMHDAALKLYIHHSNAGHHHL
jgi:insertion element IS1 protein InsB